MTFEAAYGILQSLGIFKFIEHDSGARIKHQSHLVIHTPLLWVQKGIIRKLL
jgi:hypothetical protein